MQRFAQVARVGFASGMITLGVIGFVFRDFAAVWGPLPNWVPLEHGARPRLRGGGARGGNRPALPADRACGVAVAVRLHRAVVDAAQGARGAQGTAHRPVGLSHFAYTNLTVPLVPSWLPCRLGWAYLTGACHLAAGLGVLLGVLPRLAAQLEAAMLGIFTTLVWIPLVAAAPTKRGNRTQIWISWALTAAAAVVAAHVPPRSGAVPGGGLTPHWRRAMRDA